MPSSIYAEHYYINEYGERINITIPNRILSSQVKTNNEVIDSWSKFKVADYLDVDNQWGDISNLKVFKDRLFYFQDTGVGIASVNERSLVTDDNANQLVLGTGGILSRYDYITNTNGDSVINDRSIVNSDNVLYWYDYDKNEICSYSGAVS
nr:MAG TPA: stabilization protein [Crassvirales sp.]